jgi:hypothetical protein
LFQKIVRFYAIVAGGGGKSSFFKENLHLCGDNIGKRLNLMNLYLENSVTDDLPNPPTFARITRCDRPDAVRILLSHPSPLLA